MAKKPNRLAAPIDGASLFREATGVTGLMAGWRKVSANLGAAGGDRASLEAFAVYLAIVWPSPPMRRRTNCEA
jgi:hypothetical protein